jgi:hypothetical protein
VRSFYTTHSAVADALSNPAYHRVNSCLHFRKELTETMAVVTALADVVASGDAPHRPGGNEQDSASANDNGTTTSCCCGVGGGVDIGYDKRGCDEGCSACRHNSEQRSGAKRTGDVVVKTRVESEDAGIRSPTTANDNVDVIKSTTDWMAAADSSSDWHVLDLCR